MEVKPCQPLHEDLMDLKMANQGFSLLVSSSNIHIGHIWVSLNLQKSMGLEICNFYDKNPGVRILLAKNWILL